MIWKGKERDGGAGGDGRGEIGKKGGAKTREGGVSNNEED